MQSSLPRRPIAKVEATILDDGAVLIDVERQVSYRLNRRATFIWLRLSEGTPILDIAREIAGAHADMTPTVRLVEALHENFVRAGVLDSGESEPNSEPQRGRAADNAH